MSNGDAEKSSLGAQKPQGRTEAILRRVAELAAILGQQGSVVATYREYKGRRLGPYHRLVWREGRRRRSLYLSRDGALVAAVRLLLEEYQRPQRDRRAVERAQRCLRKALRAHKRTWAAELAQAGFRLRGYGIRGYRRLRAAGGPAGRE